MKAIAVHEVTNTMGIALYECNGEIALVGLFNMDEADRPRVHKVYWTMGGRPFIRVLGSRYYIDEFMRV